MERDLKIDQSTKRENESPAVHEHSIDLEDLKNKDIDDEELLQTDLENEFPVKNWERFEFRKLLGYGGMGIVYQAWDVKLSRLVALKFLHNNYGQVSNKRFLLEARAQCRIEHDNVCKVYEAGEVNNMPYIAMQYIDGKSLQKSHSDMTLEQKVQVMRDTALGIHAAHKLGIIHRDIKPDNIMVAQNEDGLRHPVVMDFGLAREVGNQGMTQTGAVIGTPAYMSPEQARGQVHLLDRRTDIYSLGAAFYAIIAGKPPFQGESAIEVVINVVRKDAPPISQLAPYIPADLSAIVMKCLEKDPNQRYESAQALAQDLQRYLDGEPISVRAASWLVRLRKKARKNKALFALGGAALLLVLIFSGISLWTWRQSVLKAELGRQMGEHAEKVEAMMRFVSLTAPHDIRPERQSALNEMEIIKRRMAEAGSLAEGSGNYALGRGYLAFYDYEKARQHLDRAYASGFRTPGLDFAMGQVLGEFYRRELDSQQQIEDKEASDALKSLEAEYLRPIQLHLTAYLQSKSERATQETAYLEGLLALYSKDYETAIKKAQAAMGQSSWFYEAHWLEGESYLMQAKEKAIGGNSKEADALFLKAEASFQNACKIGQSSPQAKLGLARKHALILNLSVYKGRPIEEVFEKAMAACDQVLLLNPDDVQAGIIKTTGYYRLGEHQSSNGKDPRPTLEQAIKWGQFVGSQNPQEVKGYRLLGSVYRILGKYALDRGEDPRPSLNLAAANIQKVIQLKPNYTSAYNTLGLVYRSVGQYEEKNGGDPRPFFEQSAASYKRAIELNPNFANGLTNLGRLYMDQVEYMQEHGEDPLALYELSVSSFQKAIEINPNYTYAYTNLGFLYQTRGKYEMEHGKDPNGSFELAAANLEKAVQLNSKNTFGYYSLGLLHQTRGKYEMEHGKDPNGSFELAVANLQKAARLNPDYADTFNNLGFVFYSQLDHEIRCGREPRDLFEKALSNYQKTLQINPNHNLSNLCVSLLYCRRSQWQLSRSMNPTDSLQQSRIWLEKAIALKPDFEWNYRAKAEIELTASQWAMKQRRSPEEAFAEVEAGINKAVEIKAGNAEAYRQAAQLASLQAQWAAYNRQDPKPALTRGLEMIEKSLVINPHYADAYAVKGTLLQAEAKATNNSVKTRQAMEVLEKAFQINQWLKHNYDDRF